MSPIRERARNFMRKYNIQLLNDNRRCMTRMQPRLYFSFEQDKDYVSDMPPECNYEPLITVEIPLSRLDEIADLESIFFNNIDDENSRRIFQRWLEQQNEEKRLRDNHPAVKKAYEHYSAMLAWCGQANKKITDLPPEE